MANIRACVSIQRTGMANWCASSSITSVVPRCVFGMLSQFASVSLIASLPGHTLRTFSKYSRLCEKVSAMTLGMYRPSSRVSSSRATASVDIFSVSSARNACREAWSASLLTDFDA